MPSKDRSPSSWQKTPLVVVAGVSILAAGVALALLLASQPPSAGGMFNGYIVKRTKGGSPMNRLYILLTVMVMMAGTLFAAHEALAKVLTGTAADDTLVGTNRDDRLTGLSGHDSLTGRDGEDRLKGSRGNDRLKGSRGADNLWGSRGNDR